MKRSDITDKQVLQAAVDFHSNTAGDFITDILIARTSAPLKVVYAAMERAYSRNLIECGVSLRTAWATPKGLAILNEDKHESEST